MAEDMFAFQVTVCLCISDYMTQISCGNFAPTEREELTVKSKFLESKIELSLRRGACVCVREGGGYRACSFSQAHGSSC